MLFPLHSDNRALFGVFVLATKKAHLFVLDRVRNNQMPNMGNLYYSERTSRSDMSLQQVTCHIVWSPLTDVWLFMVDRSSL